MTPLGIAVGFALGVIATLAAIKIRNYVQGVIDVLDT